MLTAVRYMLSKLVSPLWRTVEVDGENDFLGPGVGDVRHLQSSVVTRLYLDYGMIDDAVYFTNGEVLGGVPLKTGDLVNCIAVRDGNQGGWKALRVEKSADAWEAGGSTSLEADCMQLRPLIGSVTTFDGDGGYINETTYFPRDSLWEGYEPMKGDWVQAKYFINPTKWTTQACSVAPLRYCRQDQVPVTSVFGSSGVVNDSVFFNLDSLLLPSNYQPQPGHLVNLVMVESSQSLYCWRALCMSPCQKNVNVSAAPLPEAELQSILENKGGLEVTDYGQFGEVMIGERRELVLWIQNKGSETHKLICCDFAGWDSEEQFTLVTLKGSTMLSRNKQALQGDGPTSSEKQVSDGKEVDKSSDGVQEETVCCPGVRRQEREVDISPGERLSVVVSCHTKSLGSCAELLLLHFSSFTIGRRLMVTVGSEDENLLKPRVPYTPSESRTASTTPSSHVITVTAPKEMSRLMKRRLPNFLHNYPVPQALRDCVEAGNDVLVAQPQLGEVLSPSNMLARFSALLWLEELHAERELREFTISGALLRKGSVYLHLEVHGLAEGRPSLFIGDRVLLKKARSDGVSMEYVGYAVEINDEDVSLRVNADFHRSYLGEPLDVEFSLNRLTMRRCHNALEQSKHFGDGVFDLIISASAKSVVLGLRDDISFLL